MQAHISQGHCHRTCCHAPSQARAPGVEGCRAAVLCHALLGRRDALAKEPVAEHTTGAAGRGMGGIRPQFTPRQKIAFCLFSQDGMALPGWEPLAWGLWSPPPVAGSGQHHCWCHATGHGRFSGHQAAPEPGSSVLGSGPSTPEHMHTRAHAHPRTRRPGLVGAAGTATAPPIST